MLVYCKYDNIAIYGNMTIYDNQEDPHFKIFEKLSKL